MVTDSVSACARVLRSQRGAHAARLAVAILLALWCALRATFVCASPWPTAGGSAHRSSVAAERTGASFEPSWTWRAPATGVSMYDALVTSVAVDDGVVVVVSPQGHVQALRALDGVPLWARLLPRPSLVGPTIIAGRVLVAAEDGWLRSFALADGAERWRRLMDGLPRSSVAATHEAVFAAVGAPGRSLLRLDPRNARLRWKTDETAIEQAIHSAVAVDAGTVVAADPSGKLHAFDAATGAKRWVYDVGAPLHGNSPVIARGRVWLVAGGDHVRVHAIDAATGQAVAGWPVSWSEASGAPPAGRQIALSQPTLIDDVIAFQVRFDDRVATREGAWNMHEWLVGLHAGSGVELWHVPRGSARASSFDERPALATCPSPAVLPALDHTSARLASASSLVADLMLIDAIGGHTSHAHALDAPSRGAIAFSDGRLYITTDAGTLFAFASNDNVAPALSSGSSLMVTAAGPVLALPAAVDPQGDVPSYQIRIDNDAEALESWLEQLFVPAGRFGVTLPSSLRAGQTYNVWVRAQDGAGAQSEWSPPTAIVVDPPPTASAGAEAIAAELAAAAPGSVVTLAPGRLVLAKTLNVPAGVTLRGAGAHMTSIDGAGVVGPAVKIEPGAPSMLADVTLANAATGIEVGSGARLRVEHVVFVDDAVAISVAAGGTGEANFVTAVGGDVAADVAGSFAIGNAVVARHRVVLRVHPSADAHARYLDLYDNQVPFDGVVVHSGVMHAPVQFRDESAWDFRLLPGQPTTDRGDPREPFDREPVPRGDRVNLGAFGGTEHAETSVDRSDAGSQGIDSGTVDAGPTASRRQGGCSAGGEGVGGLWLVGVALWFGRRRARRGHSTALACAVAAFLFGQANAHAAIARVQARTATGGTSAAVTWTPSTTAGNLLVAVVSFNCGSGATITVPTGFSLAVRSSTAAGNLIGTAIYYAANAASQATSAFGISGTGCSAMTVNAAEYSGVATISPLDKAASEQGWATNTWSGTTATTTQADELIVVGFGVISNVTFTWGSPYSQINSVSNGTTMSGSIGERIVTSTGTFGTGAGIGATSRDFGGAIATFKEATISSATGPRYWCGTNTGGTGDSWSSAVWYTSSACTTQATTPGAADDVYFHSGSLGKVNIDTSISVNSITIGTSYTGTLTQASGASITVAGGWTQSGGTFTGGNSALTIGGAFALNLGTFTGGSGTITVGGNFTLANTASASFTSTSGLLDVGGAFTKGSSASFTHASGKIMLSSATSQTFAPGGATFYDLIVNDGLVAYWKLDETTAGSAVVDASGYGRNGTPSNNPAPTTAPWTRFLNDKALQFTGSSSQRVAASASGLPGVGAAKTISLWVYHTAVPSASGDFVSFGDGSSFGLQLGFYRDSFTSTTYYAAYNWGGTRLASTTPASNSSWHHIAYTYDGTTHRLYVDGDLANSGTTAPQSGTASILRIGCSSVNSQYFTGSLDDIRIYERALGATEVSALAQRSDPGTFVATQTLNGAVTVAGTLTLAAGKLDVSSSNYAVTVGFDWYNYGGQFDARAGTATLNDNPGRISRLRSGAQRFYNLTFNRSGNTWGLDDPLNVLGTIALTAGTLDTWGNTIHAANFTKSAGTFSPSSGTVVIDSASSQSPTVTNFQNLRFENATETSLLAYWKFDEVTGSSGRDWTGNGATATLANGVEWSLFTPSSSVTFDNQGSVQFDGADDRATATLGADASTITISAWIYSVGAGASTRPTVIEMNAYTLYIVRGQSGENNLGLGFYAWQNGGAAKGVWNSDASSVADSAWTHVAVTYSRSSNSSVPTFYVNGVAKTTSTITAPTGTFDSNAGAAYIGSNWNNTRPFNGFVDDLRVYSRALSAAEISALAYGRYPAGGSATYTLGGNTTVAGTLSIDSGVVDAGGYTMAVTGAANLYAGTYKANTAAQTFSGGLTTWGTLDLNTSGAQLLLGSNKTLSINGRLYAGSLSTKPTIKAATASTYYTMTVTYPATLDVDGLQVQNTQGNGLDIGGSVTLTTLRNVAFSGGTGTSYLKIDGGNATLQGFSFADSTPTYNVQAAGGARVIMEYRDSTTNGSGAGESRDLDDDANNDGLAETSTYGSSIVRWIYAARTDTAGSSASARIEGFPTAAFDWSTFAYYSTYVVTRDYVANTTDRIWVRSANGDPKSSAYYADVAVATNGRVVGTPRWDTVGSTRYLYVGTDTGKVLRYTDDGSSLTLTNTWSPTSLTKVTSPIVYDANYLYFGGQNGTTNNLYALVKTTGAHATSSPQGTTATLAAAPTMLAVSGTTYLFSGMPLGSDSRGHVRRWQIGTTTTLDNSDATGDVAGAVLAFNGMVYTSDHQGTVRGINASTLATAWSYHDNTRHSGCAAGSSCAMRGGVYFDGGTSRVYVGDDDGHLYALSTNSSSASIVTNWPVNPNSTTESFTNAVLARAGIVVAGTSSGSLFIVDEDGGGAGVPALVQTYRFGSAVTTVAYDRTGGNYMVGTANGRLYYINTVTPTNLVSNPGFESGTTSWTRTGSGGTAGTVTPGYSGTYALRTTASYDRWQQSVSFVEGESYDFSAWGKNASGTCKVGVNGGGGPSGTFGGDVATTFGSSWTQKSGTVWVPPGTTWMQVYMQTDTGGDCNVDDFVLRKR